MPEIRPEENPPMTEDDLEAAYWRFDTLRAQGMAERDAFKSVLRVEWAGGWYPRWLAEHAARIGRVLTVPELTEYLTRAYRFGLGEGASGRDRKVQAQRDAIRSLEKRNASLVEKLAAQWARATRAETDAREIAGQRDDARRYATEMGLEAHACRGERARAEAKVDEVRAEWQKSEERLRAEIAGHQANTHRLARESHDKDIRLQFANQRAAEAWKALEATEEKIRSALESGFRTLERHLDSHRLDTVKRTLLGAILQALPDHEDED